MFDLNNWLAAITSKIKEHFKNRVLFIGFQGSYRRGEAKDTSDIDMVIILDYVSIDDLKVYRNIVQTMPNPEKACGFIGGLEEVKNWSKGELFQLYYDTEPIEGDLKNLIPIITKADAKEAAKIGAQTLYHMACHSFLYDKDHKESLIGLYKMVFFTIQAAYFYKNGEYILAKDTLLSKLSGRDKEILEISKHREEIQNYTPENIEESYKKLIAYCSNILKDL